MSGLEKVAIAINAVVGVLAIVALSVGWWLSRHTRRRDEYRLDIDADTAAELRAKGRDEW